MRDPTCSSYSRLGNNHQRPGKQTDLFLLDFSKAFDSVPHKRLLYKLSYYGITGKTNNWINAFLSNRRQCVSINGNKSQWVDVISGVPQGTVLGPTLFLVYINDIFENVSSQMRLFADDSILYRQIDSPDDHKILQRDLETVLEWSKTWQMRFNIDKCHRMSITRRRKPINFDYRMEGKPIIKSPTEKYLGVVLSEDLRWNAQCKEVRSKASRILGILKRNLGPCSKEVKTRAYHAMVRPRLEYATAAWNPHTDKNVDSLEMVQRQAARFVCSDYRRTTSVTGLLENLGWDTLEHRRLLIQSTMFYKIHNNLVNIVFPLIIIPQISNTRSSHQFQFQQVQTNNLTFQNSFFPRMIPVWNHLPSTAVLATTVKSFQEATSPALKIMRPTPGLRRF